jgi:hypothetical protein
VYVAGGQTAHTLTLQRNVSMSIYHFKDDDEFIVSLKEYYTNNPFDMKSMENISPSKFVSVKHTEETKKLMSEARLGIKRPPMSEEQKIKLSNVKKNKKWNEKRKKAGFSSNFYENNPMKNPDSIKKMLETRKRNKSKVIG